MPEEINFEIAYEHGPPGISAFEEWKRLTNQPNASFNDFMVEFGVSGGANITGAHVNEDMHLIIDSVAGANFSATINNDGDLILTT